MSHQTPIVCGSDDARPLDITSPDALYLLQPTRVVARKRIWRNWDLIGALLQHPPFREVFEQRPDMTVTLHVTGPVPIEHRSCLEQVLDAYQAVLDELPADIGRRLFLAFSAGCQADPTSTEQVDIVDIYQLADLVVFPSLTEGRGLPIAEASAAGIPIVCSHYEPQQVFDEVVGMHLDEADRIEYDEFPPAQFSDELLDRITTILLDPTSETDRIDHNRAAVRRRYSLDVLQESFVGVLDRLERTVRSH
jgi:glycosyltransferase involved in cell wall biosynthesis